MQLLTRTPVFGFSTPWKPKGRLWTPCRLVLHLLNLVNPSFFRKEQQSPPMISCSNYAHATQMSMCGCVQFSALLSTPFLPSLLTSLCSLFCTENNYPYSHICIFLHPPVIHRWFITFCIVSTHCLLRYIHGLLLTSISLHTFSLFVLNMNFWSSLSLLQSPRQPRRDSPELGMGI